MTRDQIKTVWESRKKGVVVRDVEKVRDFNTWHIRHMDSGQYQTTETPHELMDHWRHARRQES